MGLTVRWKIKKRLHKKSNIRPTISTGNNVEIKVGQPFKKMFGVCKVNAVLAGDFCFALRSSESELSKNYETFSKVLNLSLQSMASSLGEQPLKSTMRSAKKNGRE